MGPYNPQKCLIVTSSTITKKLEIYKNLEIELEIDKNLEIELEIYKNLENFEFYFKIFVNFEFYFEFFVISSFLSMVDEVNIMEQTRIELVNLGFKPDQGEELWLHLPVQHLHHECEDHLYLCSLHIIGLHLLPTHDQHWQHGREHIPQSIPSRNC